MSEFDRFPQPSSTTVAVTHAPRLSMRAGVGPPTVVPAPVQAGLLRHARMPLRLSFRCCRRSRCDLDEMPTRHLDTTPTLNAHLLTIPANVSIFSVLCVCALFVIVHLPSLDGSATTSAYLTITDGAK